MTVVEQERQSSGAGGTAPSRIPNRRHPIHLPNLERHNQPIIIFLTVCTHTRSPVLASATAHDLLIKAWESSRQWRVGRYMIMPDHAHLFCSPAMRDSENILVWAAYWKGLIARAKHGFGPLASVNSGAGGTAPSRDEGGTAATPSAMVGETANPAVHTRAPFWQRDCWDTQLRDAGHYGDKWSYVALNPVRRGLVSKPEDWPFQGELNELRW